MISPQIASADPGRGEVFWHGRTPQPALHTTLLEDLDCDVVVVGAGFTGAWAALILSEREPSASIVMIDSGQVSRGASGRAGGFVDPALAHTIGNAESRWPEESAAIVELGNRNMQDIVSTIERENIGCDFRLTGEYDVALRPWQQAQLLEVAGTYERHGQPYELLEGERIRDLVRSPLYRAAIWRPEVALVDPAALNRGLVAAAQRRGVRVYEGTPATKISCRAKGGGMVHVATPEGTVRARHVVVATNAWVGDLLPRLRRRYAPVVTRVAVTERLAAGAWEELGWRGGWGVATGDNLFFYYRPTPDGRILIGGGDGQLAQRSPSSQLDTSELEEQLRATFPQLGGVRIQYRWDGLTAVTTDTSFMLRTQGPAVAVFGYTGLGVAASRFAALLAVEQILSPSSELLRMRFVSRTPWAIPTGPVRTVGVSAVRRALRSADRREGERGLLLRALARAGIDFEV
jgi:glycine/D-amino acid oxidase-like deaminating enzyme